MYKFLHLLFEDDVRPASEFFRAPVGPKCVAHMAWGNGIKPFYYDALQTLRATAYQVLQYAIRNSKLYPSSPAVEYYASGSTKEVTEKSAAKVILVTRRFSDDKLRMIGPKTEDRIIQLFRKQGYNAEVCCDFKVKVQFDRMKMVCSRKLFPYFTGCQYHNAHLGPLRIC
jgi:hypothetical protein